MDQGFAHLARGLRLSAARLPNKPALIELGRITLTYAALWRGAVQLANWMSRRGLHKGDHVAVLTENSVEHILCLYAISTFGGVSIALDPKWTSHEIANAVVMFDIKFILCDRGLADRLAPQTYERLTFGVLAFDCQSRGSELLDLVASESVVDPAPRVSDQDVSTIILTSGTTGLPKGAMRSHRNVEIGCMMGALGKGQSAEGSELAAVPIFYGSGRGSVLGQLYLGATVYILKRFIAEEAAQILESEKITAVALAPTMCQRLLDMPDLERFDFSAITSLRKAGSPFTLQMASELITRVTPNIYQGYASTESGSVALLRPGDQLRKLGSAGPIEWGVEAELVNADGEAVPRVGQGELRVRGPNVCLGYYNNPEEQTRAFRDGWFHTGDLARFDEDGYLYIVGRLKDTIKTGSINVSPREIETVILGHPDISDVAVIGVPHREWGEAVVAFVVPKAGATVLAEDVLNACRAQLAGYKLPKAVEFISEIERNGLGKVTPEFKTRMRQSRGS
jgi:acyl-CoA synthetase (AMP-forming)/AMP-acid ligase II